MQENPHQQVSNSDLIPFSNPQLVKIYADLQTKRDLCLFWCLFFILTIAIYIITIGLPTAIINQGAILYPECPTSCLIEFPDLCKAYKNQFPKTNVDLFLGGVSALSPFNQILILQATFLKNSNITNTKFMASFKINISVISFNNDNSRIEVLSKYKLHTIETQCFDTSSTECSVDYLAYISEISYSNYFFFIHFQDLDNYFQNFKIKSWYINKEFSVFLIALKYTLIFLTLISNVLYLRRLRMIPYTDIVIEQKLVLILGWLLTLFNDPFVGISVIVPNIASGFFSTLFITNFTCALLLFWFVLFDRIAFENGEKNSQSLDKLKVTFISIIWIFILVSYSIFTAMSLSDPISSFDKKLNKAYEAFKYIGILLFIIYTAILVKKYIAILKVYKNRIWRHQISFLFSNYFIFVLLLMLFTGSFGATNKNNRIIFLTISILNMYIFFLQYLYSPTKEGISESQTFIKSETNKYNAFDILEEKEDDIQLVFEQSNNTSQINDPPKEIKIDEETPQPLPIPKNQVIQFDNEEKSIEDLNESKDNKKADIFN